MDFTEAQIAYARRTRNIQTRDELTAFVEQALTGPLKNRRRLIGWLYYKHPRKDQPCGYCGKPADTGDHIPPIWKAHLHEPSTWHMVPACRPCNILLGQKDRATVEEGKTLIAIHRPIAEARKLRRQKQKQE